MSSIRSMQWPISAQRPRPWAALLVIAGFIHETRGRWSVLRGTISHNDIMRASGHRQQLVGMLQRFWKKDRRSIERWVDSLLTSNAAGRLEPFPVR
jgi:hypothetical protein